MSKKQCTSCKVTKPLTEFFKRSNSKSGLTSECKVCNYTSVQKARVLRKYGITIEEVKHLLELQGCKCLICKEDLDRYCIDHCHKNNKVRGLLCNNCNLLLGMSKDSIEILNQAIKYLKVYKSLSKVKK